MLPIWSISTSHPASRAQRMNTSRPWRSTSVRATRHTPPRGVAPILAISISDCQSRSPLIRNASILPPLPPPTFSAKLAIAVRMRALARTSTGAQLLPMPKFVDTVGNALQGLTQVCLRVGIGKAQVAFTVHTEIDAGQRSNATGLKEIIGQFLGRPADL